MRISKELQAKADREAARCTRKPREQMPKPDRADVLRRRAKRKGSVSASLTAAIHNIEHQPEQETGVYSNRYGHIIDREGTAPLIPEETA